jgi:hypothetical protein
MPLSTRAAKSTQLSASRFLPGILVLVAGGNTIQIAQYKQSEGAIQTDAMNALFYIIQISLMIPMKKTNLTTSIALHFTTVKHACKQTIEPYNQ